MASLQASHASQTGRNRVLEQEQTDLQVKVDEADQKIQAKQRELTRLERELTELGKLLGERKEALSASDVGEPNTPENE